MRHAMTSMHRFPKCFPVVQSYTVGGLILRFHPPTGGKFNAAFN